MARAMAVDNEGPGVGSLVPQRVLLLPRRQMRGDRDPVRLAVPDFSSRQLAVRQSHNRCAEAESVGQPIIEKL
jgi:hypothetical protein